MENTVSKAAAVQVIEDQIIYWAEEITRNAVDLMHMEQRFKDNTCTLDGLILYKQDHGNRVFGIRAVLVELYAVKEAMERL